jgi:hypothetical protein
MSATPLQYAERMLRKQIERTVEAIDKTRKEKLDQIAMFDAQLEALDEAKAALGAAHEATLSSLVDTGMPPLKLEEAAEGDDEL